MSISDGDWDDDSAFKPLSKFNFFAYSGADGDLLRKNGLAGWRVSVYGSSSIRIQKKTGTWRGRNQWSTVRKWETDDREAGFSQEDIDEFEAALETLVETGELEK